MQYWSSTAATTRPPRTPLRCNAVPRARYLSRDDVPEDIVASERRIAEETSARAEGKPEQAPPKIVEGRLNGFKDAVLLEQASVSDNKRIVGARSTWPA